MATKVFLTSTGANTWTVPIDFTAVNTIEVIGAGGGGGGQSVRFGGGGGAYSKISNLSLTPGASIDYAVGAAGTAGAPGANGGDGGDTWFNALTLGASSVGAKGGKGGTLVTGAGGDSTAGVGTTKYSGGSGAIMSSNSTGAGGGSAGPSGAGGNASGSTGGTADNGTVAGGTLGTAGVAGTQFDGSHGCGSGAGAANNGSGTTGGQYGGGASAGNAVGASGGAGFQGLICITYTSNSERYWVGGAGNWDAATTTHWAVSSGGTAGAPVPTSAENVHFDGSSGGATTTITATSNCATLVCTGFTGTIAGSSSLSVYGSFTLVSGMSYTYTGALTFAAIATGKTITTGGKTIGSVVVFDGVGGGWTLQDTTTITGASTTLTNGSLNLGNQTTSMTTFASSNSNTRVLTLGSGTMTLTGSGTPWNIATTTGMTLTANTSTIKFTNATSSSKTFSGGGLTYYNLYITGSGIGTYMIVGSNTFNDFKVDTPPHTVNFTVGTTQTLTTFTVSGTAGNLMTLQSTSGGSTWYMLKTPAGNVICDYLSLQDSHVSMA